MQNMELIYKNNGSFEMTLKVNWICVYTSIPCDRRASKNYNIVLACFYQTCHIPSYEIPLNRLSTQEKLSNQLTD